MQVLTRSYYTHIEEGGICTECHRCSGVRTFCEKGDNRGPRHTVEDVEPAIPVVQLCTVVDDGHSQSEDDSTGILVE